MSKIFIGIMGKARSGKDFFAKTLSEEFFNITKHRFVLMAYATELKMMVQHNFDLTYEQLWGEDKEVVDTRYKKQNSNEYWTAREIMQSFGEFYRSIDNHFWVKALFNIIDTKKFNNVIITDLRHINEVNPIIDRGGYIINVVNDIAESIHGSNHISEQLNYDADFTVINNYNPLELDKSSTADDLRVSARQIVNFIKNNEKIKGDFKNGR